MEKQGRYYVETTCANVFCRGSRPPTGATTSSPAKILSLPEPLCPVAAEPVVDGQSSSTGQGVCSGSTRDGFYARPARGLCHVDRVCDALFGGCSRGEEVS